MDLTKNTTTTTNTDVKTQEFVAEIETPTQIQKPKPFSFSSNGVLKRKSFVPVVVYYRECLKNHAANIGGHAVDGCGDFMPSPASNPSDPTSLKCAACGCHRNFHRRESERRPAPPQAVVPALEYQPQHRHHPPPPPPPCSAPHSPSPESPPPISSAYCPTSVPAQVVVPAVECQLQHRHQPPTPLSAPNSPSPQPICSAYYPTSAPPQVVVPAVEYQPQHRHQPSPPHSAPNSPSPPPISSSYYPTSVPQMLLALSSGFSGEKNSNPDGKKRVRTKFTADQKIKMQAFAERVEWKLQKQGKDQIEQFCREIGVEKSVLKVWMHNNKPKKLTDHDHYHDHNTGNNINGFYIASRNNGSEFHHKYDNNASSSTSLN